MAWKYDKAIKKGKSVTVTLKDDSDPEKIQARSFTWGYDPSDGMTQGEFKVMVKQEVKYMLNHLNRSESEQDVTPDFQPLTIP